MRAKNAKQIAKIDRQLDRLEAEFATIKQRADELTIEFKRLSPEYTKLMERTEQINKEQRWTLEEQTTRPWLPAANKQCRPETANPGSNFFSAYNYWCPIKTFYYL